MERFDHMVTGLDLPEGHQGLSVPVPALKPRVYKAMRRRQAVARGENPPGERREALVAYMALNPPAPAPKDPYARGYLLDRSKAFASLARGTFRAMPRKLKSGAWTPPVLKKRVRPPRWRARRAAEKVSAR